MQTVLEPMYFTQGLQEYGQRYRKLFSSFSEAGMERAGFLHFCGTHGLTLQGRGFLFLFRLKSLVRRLPGRSAQSKRV